MSAKYVDQWPEDPAVDYSLGHSLEYKIGDAHKSIAFSPDEDISVSISNPELNPEWSTDVQDFLAATTDNTINLMRLDIGGGNVTYMIDGEEASVGGNSYVEGNSIVFVDNALLSEPVMVDQHEVQSAIFDQDATAESLGISEADFQTVKTIHTQSNTYDESTMIDVNGALYLPFEPVDLSGFDPATETLKIVLQWDIAGAVTADQDQYMVDQRVAGTPFDFSVELVRE